MEEITQREVFYIAGYDPRGYRYYYSLYKKNAKKQNKINNLDIQVSKTKKTNSFINTCKITTKNGTKVDYNFLAWNDIVKENWAEGFFKNFIDTLYFVKMYLLSGICVRFARESRAQLVGGLYPLSYLLITILFTLFISYTSYEIAGKHIPSYMAVLVSCIIFLLGIKVIEKIGNKIAVFWLSRIYAFCARWSENKILNIEERVNYFAEHIFNQIKNYNKENKEFILSAHSVGTILAVSIASKVIKKCVEENIDYKNFKLLTLGECIPLISYHKKTLYKQELENLGKTKNFTWIDYTAPIDGACFPLVDPITSSGIKKDENCGAKIMSTRFFKLYKKDNYKKIKKNKYKAHFLYLMSTDLLGNYNYFDITAGIKPLEDRIQTYKKEK